MHQKDLLNIQLIYITNVSLVNIHHNALREIRINVLITYLLLVQKLKESQKNIRKSKLEYDSDTALIIQLAVITISNIICWFPANGIVMIWKIPVHLIFFINYIV